VIFFKISFISEMILGNWDVDWINLAKERNQLYSSPNIVRVIKSRRMKWAGHVARMGEERGCIGSWWGNRREEDH